MIKATIPISIPPGMKLLRIGLEQDGWRLWIHHDITCRLGTYILLKHDGSIDQVTIYPDGLEEIVNVKR